MNSRTLSLIALVLLAALTACHAQDSVSVTVTTADGRTGKATIPLSGSTTTPVPRPQPNTSPGLPPLPASKDTTIYPSGPWPVNASGCSIITPAGDAKSIYVSADGDDDNDGGMASPVRTPKRALALARNGYQDLVFFRAGDDFGELGEWKNLGRSATEPDVLTSYGVGPRPKLGRVSLGKWQKGAGLALIGLDLTFADRIVSEKPPTELAGSGAAASSFYSSATIDGLLIEDCELAWGVDGITVVGWTKNLVIRKNIIHHQWTIGAKSQGIYVSNEGEPLTIEGNLLWHNGWNAGWWKGEVVGGQKSDSVRTIYSHATYIQTTAGRTLFRNNIVLAPASIGSQLRNGGQITGNVYAECAGLGFVAAGDNLVANNLASEGVYFAIGFHDLSPSKSTVLASNVFVSSKATGDKAWGTNGKDVTGEGNVVVGWKLPVGGAAKLFTVPAAGTTRRVQNYARLGMGLTETRDGVDPLADIIAAGMNRLSPDPRVTASALNAWVRADLSAN